MTEKLDVNEKEPAFGQKTPTTVVRASLDTARSHFSLATGE